MLQLPVYGNPERLENPGRRIDRPPFPRNGAADNLGKLPGRQNRLVLSGLDDPPRDSATVAFLTVLIKEIGKILRR